MGIMLFICWLVAISVVAIPILPMVEPMQVTNIECAGIFLHLSKPCCDNFVFVDMTSFTFPKSAGLAHKNTPLS